MQKKKLVLIIAMLLSQIVPSIVNIIDNFDTYVNNITNWINKLFDDNTDMTISSIRAKCRKLKLEKGIKMVIVDYLQLMKSGAYSDSRQNEVSDISRALKVMARELDVPVVVGSQLSREVEKRADKRPMLSDLRESGSIEQDADVVMFLYRDDYYNKESQFKNIAEVIIGKHRNGSTGTVQLAFDPTKMAFRNLSFAGGKQPPQG